MKGQPIETLAQLQLEILLRYRFVSAAAKGMGFTSNRDYQRFRNTLLGSSRDLQVIKKLTETYSNINTYKIWGIRL